MGQRVLLASPDGAMTHNATIRDNEDANTTVAELKYRKIADSGEIITFEPPTTYKVEHKFNSGEWQLVNSSEKEKTEPLITAEKPKWHRNIIVFKMNGDTFEMSRPTPLNRNYVVWKGVSGKKEGDGEKGPKVGEVTADGTFKRSYKLTFDGDIRVELPLFCYWMVNMLNKRSNHQYNSGSAANAAVH